MSWWGWKKKSPPPSAAPSEPGAPPLWREMNERIGKLEQLLAEMAAKHPQVNIETVHLHQPVLEQLTFRLDQLDIKELSGSLNLGNNFGANINPDGLHLSQKRDAEASKSAPDTPPAARPAPGPAHGHKPGHERAARTAASPQHNPMQRTTAGYKFTLGSSRSGGA